MRDVMSALRSACLATPEIAALVGDRVYVNRIPRAVIEAADTFHPPKMLVLRQAGGIGKADFLPTDSPRVTALCYGESDLEADKVRRAVWDRFVHLTRECIAVPDGDVLIHDITVTSGAVSLVDPDIVWPAVAQSYSVLADVAEEVA